MCEARSRQFEEKTKMYTERSEPIMLITCWYLCFPVSRALWFAIHCHCLVSCRSASSSLTFFHSRFASAFFSSFYADPSTVSHLPCRAHWCSQQYADAVLTLLCSFMKCDGSAHISVYICTYTNTNTNASSESDCCHQLPRYARQLRGK